VASPGDAPRAPERHCTRAPRSGAATFAAAGLDREVPFEAADFTAVINLVLGGLGIAFLPATVVADLDVIEICDHTFTWVISVATPVGRRISAAGRAIWPNCPNLRPARSSRQSIAVSSVCYTSPAGHRRRRCRHHWKRRAPHPSRR
jgi:DNA-binding transcriptional LysR family regulator